MLLAIAVTLATPKTLVEAVLLDNTALAPLGGAVNVTVAPLTGLPPESMTVTWSGLAKGAPNGANCGVPPEAVILAGGIDDPENRKTLFALLAGMSAFAWELTVF